MINRYESAYPPHLPLAILSAAALAISGCSTSAKETSPAPSVALSPAPTQFVAGCDTYAVYSQNRYQPYGTAVRDEPSTTAAKTNTLLAANEVIPVDGWKHTGTVAYPTNIAPIRNDVWFHLAHTGGWVSFAGVRGAPTTPDLAAPGSSTQGKASRAW